MAHFAKIDSNGIVTQVIVVKNDILLENGVEKEQKGKDFIQECLMHSKKYKHGCQ